MVKIVKGDLFDSSAKYLCHQANCQGVMGSGVAATIKSKYPEAHREYATLCNNTVNKATLLGMVQYVHCKDGRVVCNLLGQEKFGYDGKCYTSYEALRECFEDLKAHISPNDEIAMPYLMGCYRGGGDWSKVYAMIEEIFEGYNIVLYRKDVG